MGLWQNNNSNWWVLCSMGRISASFDISKDKFKMLYVSCKIEDITQKNLVS